MSAGPTPRPAPAGVGTLREGPLHAALKAWYARPGDQVEVPVDGYVVDLVRDGLLIEIQTRGFPSAKRKLAALTAAHPVRLVHPIAATRWIVKPDADGVTSRRRSPKRGAVVDVFAELVSFPGLLTRDGFELEVLLTHEDGVRRPDPARWRRHGWAVVERRLIEVVSRHRFTTPGDLAALLPPGLPKRFTTGDLAAALGRPRRLAQQAAYCLRACGLVEAVGRSRGGITHALVDRAPGGAGAR